MSVISSCIVRAKVMWGRCCSLLVQIPAVFLGASRAALAARETVRPSWADVRLSFCSLTCHEDSLIRLLGSSRELGRDAAGTGHWEKQG